MKLTVSRPSSSLLGPSPRFLPKPESTRFLKPPLLSGSRLRVSSAPAPLIMPFIGFSDLLPEEPSLGSAGSWPVDFLFASLLAGCESPSAPLGLAVSSDSLSASSPSDVSLSGSCCAGESSFGASSFGGSSSLGASSSFGASPAGGASSVCSSPPSSLFSSAASSSACCSACPSSPGPA